MFQTDVSSYWTFIGTHCKIHQCVSVGQVVCMKILLNFVKYFFTNSCLFWYLDYTAPRIRITSQPDSSSPSPTIGWSSTEDVEFECSFDDGEFFDCGDGTTGSWTGKNVPDGPHAFVIQGKDKVGNTGRFTYSWSKGMKAGFQTD